MNFLLLCARSVLVLLSTKPLKAISGVRRLPGYFRDLRALSAATGPDAPFQFGRPYPSLFDKKAASGIARGHYFHQDLLVARRVFLNAPDRHVDVGSRIDGFVAHLAAFRPVKVIDIRPLSSTIETIEFLQADMMGELDPALVGYSDSVSCLHALEHFGLGRYGDPVRADGYLAGLANLGKLLKPGGKLYLSVPIGPQRIEFNAHRVFAVTYLLSLFAGCFVVDGFSYVDDRGDLHRDAALTPEEVARNFGCRYGCGIFELTKT